MTLNEMILELTALKELHGDIDVTVWQYAGVDEELCDTTPVFDFGYGVITLETYYRNLGERR